MPNTNKTEAYLGFAMKSKSVFVGMKLDEMLQKEKRKEKKSNLLLSNNVI